LTLVLTPWVQIYLKKSLFCSDICRFITQSQIYVRVGKTSA